VDTVRFTTRSPDSLYSISSKQNSHTAIITSSGALYTWGDKENGVAGHGETEGGHQYVPKLLERLAGKRIVQLSACGFHTGCLTSDGELYTWGEGKFGRLGLNNERNAHSPRLVETMIGKKPRQVSCGGFHTAVVSAFCRTSQKWHHILMLLGAFQQTGINSFQSSFLIPFSAFFFFSPIGNRGWQTVHIRWR
jgi:alpha-tubulin suppressor-like RCC1 family protein